MASFPFPLTQSVARGHFNLFRFWTKSLRLVLRFWISVFAPHMSDIKHVPMYAMSYLIDKEERRERSGGRERQRKEERMREGDLPLSTVILNWNCANLLTQSATSFLIKLPIMSLIIFTSKEASLSLFLHKVCIFFSEALQPYCFYELKKPKAHPIDFTVLCYRINY